MTVNVETLKAMKKSGMNMIIIQALAAIALILLPNILPNGFIKFIGVIAIVLGVALIFITVKKPNEFVTWKSYVLPIAIVAIGLYVFIQTEETIRFIAIAIGLATVLKGIGTIFLKDSPVQNPRYKIFGIISIVIGVSIIILSEDIGVLFSYYIAAILVYHAIIDFLIYLDLSKFIESAGSSETITITRD